MNSVQIPPVEGQQIVYANLQKNRFSPGYSLIVKKCKFCKMEHVHSGEEGHRSAHCFNKRTGKSLPISGYILQVDWSNPKNTALREDYEKHSLTVGGPFNKASASHRANEQRNAL